MTEVKVQVIVVGQPGAPVATVGTTEMTVVEGQTITMECEATGRMSVCVTVSLRAALTFSRFTLFLPFCPSTQGSPPPVVTWSKLRAPLPWKHSMVGGVLTLPSVGRQDSGQYICNATNTHGYSEAYTQMEVESEWTTHTHCTSRTSLRVT